jgi:hypothetical protein
MLIDRKSHYCFQVLTFVYDFDELVLCVIVGYNKNILVCKQIRRLLCELDPCYIAEFLSFWDHSEYFKLFMLTYMNSS